MVATKVYAPRSDPAAAPVSPDGISVYQKDPITIRARDPATLAKPRTKAETIAYLKSQGEAFASFLEGLSDDFLAESVAMPPGAEPATKTRLEMLLSPKEHEMHHRGQLMLLQRTIGLVPHLTRQMQERMAQYAPEPQATTS